MKKIIFAGITAVAFSVAIGAASAYEYNSNAKTAAKAGMCGKCTCQACACPDCENGNCANGCCADGACCSKK